MWDPVPSSLRTCNEAGFPTHARTRTLKRGCRLLLTLLLGASVRDTLWETEGGPSFLFPGSEALHFCQGQGSVHGLPGMIDLRRPCQRARVPAHPSSSALDSTHQPPAPLAHFLAKVSAHIMVGWLVNFLSASPGTLFQWSGKAHRPRALLGPAVSLLATFDSRCSEPIIGRDPKPSFWITFPERRMPGPHQLIVLLLSPSVPAEGTHAASTVTTDCKTKAGWPQRHRL